MGGGHQSIVDLPAPTTIVSGDPGCESMIYLIDTTSFRFMLSLKMNRK